MVDFVAEHYTTAEDFLSALRLSDRRWWTYSDITQDPDQDWQRDWIFRGQSGDWPLLPKVWRKELWEEDKILGKIRKEINTRHGIIYPLLEELETKEFAYNRRPQNIDKDDDKNRIAELALNAFVELTLINEFSQIADELGFKFKHLPQELKEKHFPLAYINLVFPEGDSAYNINDKVRKLSIKEGMRKYSDLWINPWFYRYDVIEYPWLNSVVALAQHHGIPTRLLDWTRNPLTAAFFAVNGIEDTDAEHIVVFALNTRMINFSGSHIKLFNVPASENDFLRAQSGVFTVDLMGDEYFRENGSYPDLETSTKYLAQIPSSPISPRKLMLPVSKAPELMRLLWLEKVTYAHLMPTLDNVARAVEIKVRWSGNTISTKN